MLSAFDISTAGLFVSGLKVWQLVLTIIEIVCSIGSIIMVLIATVWFLILLHGRTVKVFKSEDIIDKDIHKEKSEFAAVWVMDKYTNAVGEMREIIHKKQKSFVEHCLHQYMLLLQEQNMMSSVRLWISVKLVIRSVY